jgi:hypothetical protein
VQIPFPEILTAPLGMIFRAQHPDRDDHPRKLFGQKIDTSHFTDRRQLGRAVRLVHIPLLTIGF